jgi:hypothetical protein
MGPYDKENVRKGEKAGYVEIIPIIEIFEVLAACLF